MSRKEFYASKAGISPASFLLYDNAFSAEGAARFFNENAERMCDSDTSLAQLNIVIAGEPGEYLVVTLATAEKLTAVGYKRLTWRDAD